MSVSGRQAGIGSFALLIVDVSRYLNSYEFKFWDIEVKKKTFTTKSRSLRAGLSAPVKVWDFTNKARVRITAKKKKICQS